MSEFGDYIRNIAIFLVFSSVVQMLAPHKRFRAYIELLLNLILMVIVFAPIAGILTGTDLDALLENSTYSYSKSLIANEASLYDEQQKEAVIVEYKQALTEQMKQLLAEQDGYTYAGGSFEVDSSDENFGAIKAVYLSVSQSGEEDTPLIRIERVEPVIPFANSADSGDSVNLEKYAALKEAISGYYFVPIENIYITEQ